MLTYGCLGTRAWKWVGEAKYRTFLNFANLFGEYDFVFCGDNGQGDLLAGQMMLKEHLKAAGDERNSDESGVSDTEEVPRTSGRAPVVRGVLIRDVLDKDVLAMESEEKVGSAAWKASLRRDGLIFHKSYIGAALELRKMDENLVSLAQLRLVAEMAVSDFLWSVNSCGGVGSWDEASAALEEDLRLANQALAAAELSQVCPDFIHQVSRCIAAAQEYSSPTARAKTIGASKNEDCATFFGCDRDAESDSESFDPESPEEPTQKLLP